MNKSNLLGALIILLILVAVAFVIFMFSDTESSDTNSTVKETTQVTIKPTEVLNSNST